MVDPPPIDHPEIDREKPKVQAIVDLHSGTDGPQSSGLWGQRLPLTPEVTQRERLLILDGSKPVGSGHGWIRQVTGGHWSVLLLWNQLDGHVGPDMAILGIVLGVPVTAIEVGDLLAASPHTRQCHPQIAVAAV